VALRSDTPREAGSVHDDGYEQRGEPGADASRAGRLAARYVVPFAATAACIAAARFFVRFVTRRRSHAMKSSAYV